MKLITTSRRLALAAWMLGTAMLMQAQPKQGSFSVIPRVGLNLANMTRNETLTDLVDQTKTLKSRIKPGVVAGVDVEYQATSLLSVSLGAHYSQQGSRYPDFEQKQGSYTYGMSDSHTDLDYLSVPLMVGVRIAEGFSVKAGVQLGSLLNAKNKFKEVEIKEVEEGVREHSNFTSHQTDLMDGCKKMDIGLPIGISYEYENVVIDARYVFGLSRIYDLDVVKSRNSVVQLTVGYRFQI